MSLGLMCLMGCAASPLRPSPEARPLMSERAAELIVVTVRNDDYPIATRAGSTIRAYGTPGRYSATARTHRSVQGLASTYGLREVSGWPIPMLKVHCIVFELPDAVDAMQMLDRLRHDSRVESAQPLQSFATLGTTYNDPYEQLQRNLPALEISQAHEWSRGAGVRIAIVDTGMDAQHPDLAGRVAVQRNFVDSDPWTFRHDRHGTAVAGVIAAVANNRQGIVGVAPEAHLYAYKACWQSQADGIGAVCNTFTLAKALAAAIDDRVQVVNLSLAGPPDPLLTRLVERGMQDGIIFVGAVPPQVGPVGFPCAVAGVLAVDMAEKHSSSEHVLLAPGIDLLTLSPEGHYDFASGSSLATANVSGVIALLLARNQKLGGAQLQRLLASTTNAASSSATALSSVNACTALASVLGQPTCPAVDTGTLALGRVQKK